MRTLRPCRDGEFTALIDIINDAASAYRGVIPPDCWHDPYMTAENLTRDIRAGVEFWGCAEGDVLLGIMGIQRVRDVDLIRHAYVRPGLQRGGVGRSLLQHFCARQTRTMLVGTWAAAHWAIDFYRGSGFDLLGSERTQELLGLYWSIPARQAEASVVLGKWGGPFSV